MYNVSQRYLNNIGKNGRTIEWYGTITLEDGETVYNFNPSNMSADNFSVTMEVSSEQIEIGSTGSAELKLGLVLTEVGGSYYLDGKIVDRYALYNSVVRLFFRLYFEDETYEDVPMGIFTVAEPSRSKKIITLDAFDNMVMFNQPVGTLGDGTPYDLINYICIQCGVVFGNTEEEIEALTNGTEVLKPGEVTTVSTWRDAIGQIASILCAVAVIGRDGKLYLKQYSTALTRQIDKSFRYSYEVADFETFYTGIRTYDMVGEEQIGGGSGADGLVYDLGTNGFIQGSNISDRVLAIMNKLDDFRYTPFSASTISDPSLECLDVLEFVGDQAVSGKYAAITSIKYGFGAMEIVCTGKNPKVKDAQSSLASTVGNMSQSKGDVRFLSATNTGKVTIMDGETKEVLKINVVASVATKILLDVDIKHTTETTEEETASTYTNTDLVATAKIFLNDIEQNYSPVQTEQDGVRTFHISYPMILGSGGNEISIRMNCDGGSYEVEIGDGQLSVIGSGVEGLKIRDISVGSMPSNLFPYGEVNYDGLSIVGNLNDGSTTVITDECAITPAEGTAISGDAEVVHMTANYNNGEFTEEFDAPVNPLFITRGEQNGNLFTGYTLPNEVAEVGDEVYALRVSLSNNGALKTYALAYTNFVLDEDGRPTYPSVKSSFAPGYPAMSAADVSFDVFRDGSKWYIGAAAGGIDNNFIGCFDLETLQSTYILPTLHDPGTYQAAIERIYGDSYQVSGSGFMLDGYMFYPNIRVKCVGYSSTFGGVAYGIIENGAIDIYVVKRAGYTDYRTVDNVRATVTTGGLKVERLHFNPIDLLTFEEVVTVPGITGSSVYGWKLAGKESVYVLQVDGTKKVVVDIDTGAYIVIPDDANDLVQTRTTYDPDRGIYITMARDTEHQYTYRMHLMWFSRDLVTWFRGGYLSPVGSADAYDLNRSTNIAHLGDYLVGAVDPVDSYIAGFSVEFQTEV